MKKKIALVITIAVCIVSVSANVYQYRVIRNKDAQIVWNQTTEDQMFQGILGHIQEEILYLQTCEPDEKDFRIGVAFGYCREAVNAYITTSYGASWKEHDLQQMVSEFEGYLENLQSDETQWKNAKNGDIILMHDIFDSSVTAALEIVDRLKERGYVFVTADQLILDLGLIFLLFHFIIQ